WSTNAVARTRADSSVNGMPLLPFLSRPRLALGFSLVGLRVTSRHLVGGMRRTGCRPFQLIVMRLQPGCISWVGQDLRDQLEQGAGIRTLGVQWVKKGARQVLATVKAVTYARQHALLPPANHVEHDAPAVTPGISTKG